MQTLKLQDWTEVSWRNIMYIDKFIVKTRLEHATLIELKYFQ